MSDSNRNIIGILYGTELFGRERENIECYKTLQSIGWSTRVFSSYREAGGGAVGRELTRYGLLEGLLPFGSHFALSYFRTIKGYTKRQFQRVRDCSRIVLKHIQEQQPKALLLGSHTEYLYLWPALWWNRIPVIYRVGDGPIWDSPFHMFAMKRLLKRASIVVPVSHFIADQCAQLLPGCQDKTHVIWNIPPSFVSGSSGQSDTSNSIQDTLRIVYVGQMNEKKGVRVLIEALNKIRSTVRFECRIVGGSQFSSDFEKEMHTLVQSLQLSEFISFTGRVPDPTPHYDWANLHIAPSLYEEPFGLVIVEAKRAGIPSVVFPRGGMPELVEHQKNGWVCKEANIDDLAHALIHCVASPLTEWGKAAHEHHLQAFSKERFAQDWVRLMNQLDH